MRPDYSHHSSTCNVLWCYPECTAIWAVIERSLLRILTRFGIHGISFWDKKVLIQFSFSRFLILVSLQPLQYLQTDYERKYKDQQIHKPSPALNTKVLLNTCDLTFFCDFQSFCCCNSDVCFQYALKKVLANSIITRDCHEYFSCHLNPLAGLIIIDFLMR